MTRFNSLEHGNTSVNITQDWTLPPKEHINLKMVNLSGYRSKINTIAEMVKNKQSTPYKVLQDIDGLLERRKLADKKDIGFRIWMVKNCSIGIAETDDVRFDYFTNQLLLLRAQVESVINSKL